jgi:hypothetical protein
MRLVRSDVLAEADARVAAALRRVKAAEDRIAAADRRAEEAECRRDVAVQVAADATAVAESRGFMLDRVSEVGAIEAIRAYLAILERGGSTAEVGAARQALAGFVVPEKESS